MLLDTELSDIGIYYLSYNLNLFNTLKQLYLCGNSITYNSIKILCLFFDDITNLEILDLRCIIILILDNYLDDNSAKDLSLNLKKLPNIIELLFSRIIN